MPIRWDDIEILQLIDDAEQSGEPTWALNGTAIMQKIAQAQGVVLPTAADELRCARELDNLRDSGYLKFESQVPGGNVAWPDPDRSANDYLQRTWKFELLPAGRDRARGRIVFVPPPDPDEDDGRMIAGSTLEDVARAVADAYTGTQLERFLNESGIPPEWTHAFDGGTKWVYVQGVLVALAEGVSAQRRAIRQLIGSWLEHRLHSGPDAATRDRIARDLARQGWFVREDRLVCGEPVYPTPQAAAAVARPARLAALHPLIVEVSRQLIEDGHRGGAILQAFTAVNNRVKEMSERDDLDGVPLMSRVFRPEDPLIVLADLATETGRNIQSGYHRTFMGAIAAIRNPQAHELFNDMDMDEALEQLALASLLMRRLDEATVEAEPVAGHGLAAPRQA